jgi:hypothetical protein
VPTSAPPRPSAPAAATNPTPRPSERPAAAVPGRPGGGTGGSVGAGPGGGSADPAVAGPFRDDGTTRLILVGAGLSTGVTLLVAFLVFGRRRRDEEGGGLELAAAAAAPYGTVAGAPPPAYDPGTGGMDVDLPRWRRPSLLEARKSDPLRSGADAAVHMAFTTTAAVEGLERRLVRYRIVRLLDRPDELLGTTIGSLDQGDEVAIVEQSGLYRRVKTPDGRVGWLHKMTLGDVVEAPPEADGAIDPDVLTAYLAARGRT